MAALRKAFADAFIKTAKADKAVAGASISARFSDRVHNLFIETVTKELQTSGKVSIPGFGSWSVVQRAARTAINPQAPTGPKIQVPAKKVVTFKAAKQLKELMLNATLPQKVVRNAKGSPAAKARAKKAAK
eukprot:TRINITY_DN13597_c0_g1_i1.p1 TRINITY_DN13597_c0_g1~~TRINITY_DN13597_c0_g1_i1.p1  ORF type:complete len:138 (+),score=49.88 TRINITY_DN13597_c0_g1_i1:23-415(+)